MGVGMGIAVGLGVMVGVKVRLGEAAGAEVEVRGMGERAALGVKGVGEAGAVAFSAGARVAVDVGAFSATGEEGAEGGLPRELIRER